jgi:hypothetical protein
LNSDPNYQNQQSKLSKPLGRPVTQSNPGQRKSHGYRPYDTYSKETKSLTKFGAKLTSESFSSKIDPDSYLSHDRAVENELDSRILTEFVYKQRAFSRENNGTQPRYL